MERLASYLRQLSSDFAQDSVRSLRMLLHSPKFAMTVIVSLGLAISANTAVFSVFEMVLLRLLPVQAAEELVQVGRTGGGGLSYPMYVQIQERNQVFSKTLAVLMGRFATEVQTSSGGSADVHFSVVTPGYFDALGLPLLAGRGLPENNTAGDDALVISYSLWQRAFGGRSDVVGAATRFAGKAYTVTGVAPEGFQGLMPGQPVDAWVSTGYVEREALYNRQAMTFLVVGRLRKGIGLDRAESDMQVLARQWSEDWRFEKPTGVETVSASTGLAQARRQFRKPLVALFTLVSLLLLICAANVSSLFLGRALARQREFATRMAIGAGTGRLARQLATESLLVAALGTGAGILLAGPMTAGVVRFLAATYPGIQMDFGVNGAVLLYSLLILLAVTMLCAVAPIVVILGSKDWEQRAISRFGPGGGFRPLLGRGLIVFQVMLSYALLVVAILFAKSLYDLTQTDTGFARGNLALIHVQTAAGNGGEESSLAALTRSAQELAQTPGVQAVAFGNEALFTGNRWTESVLVADHPLPRDADRDAIMLLTSPGFLQTMKIGLRAGRDFTEFDSKPAARVAIVSEAMAKYHFQTSDVVGRSFRIENPKFARPVTIVGVVRDLKYASLKEPAPRLVFTPAAQHPDLMGRATLAVRTANDPANYLLTLERTMRAGGTDVQLRGMSIQEELIEATISQDRMLASLAVLFALSAICLACLGLYGVTANEVTRQVPEIGLRIALGAGGGQVIRTVLRGTAIALCIGTALGVALAIAAAGSVQNLLFRVESGSGPAIAAAILAISLLGLAAAYVPARRATRIDPNNVLRQQW